jgi:hypothetical protein
MVKRKNMGALEKYKKNIQIIKNVIPSENNLSQKSSFSHKGIFSFKQDSNNYIDFISSLSIELWRLKKRIQNMKTDNEKKQRIDDFSSITDQVQRIDDVLKKYEIEICDHIGENYNDGKSLKVLHIEEIENIPIGKMKVIETIKPTIYLNGKVIFFGEVIIGKSKDKRERGRI